MWASCIGETNSSIKTRIIEPYKLTTKKSLPQTLPMHANNIAHSTVKPRLSVLHRLFFGESFVKT